MKIIFVAYIGTHFRSLESQALWLKAQGHEVGFYFAANYPGASEDTEVLRAQGLATVAFDGSLMGDLERAQGTCEYSAKKLHRLCVKIPQAQVLL